MFCTSCGNEIPKDVAFCGKCGKATSDLPEKIDVTIAEAVMDDTPIYSKEDKVIAFVAAKFVAFVETQRGLAFTEELVTEIKGFKYGWVIGIVGIIIAFAFVLEAANYLVALIGAIPALLYWIYAFIKSACNAAASSWKAKVPVNEFEFSIGRSAFSHIIMTLASVVIPIVFCAGFIAIVLIEEIIMKVGELI